MMETLKGHLTASRFLAVVRVVTAGICLWNALTLAIGYEQAVQVFSQIGFGNGEARFWIEFLASALLGIALLIAWHAKIAAGVLAVLTAISLLNMPYGQHITIILDGEYYVVIPHATQNIVLLFLLLVVFLFGSGSFRNTQMTD